MVRAIARLIVSTGTPMRASGAMFDSRASMSSSMVVVRVSNVAAMKVAISPTKVVSMFIHPFCHHMNAPRNAMIGRTGATCRHAVSTGMPAMA